MKKLTLAIMALMAFTFSMEAQVYVSTTPTKRNVILEEFTGRNCQYCPDGHAIANQITANNPGRFWAVNVHAGSYAVTSYPNFNTTDGTAIANGFQIDGYPAGVVNRSTPNGQSRGAWASLANQQMNQNAECNVAGMVIVNPITRMATINVEVYYTDNSSVDENYLTIAMLQDSILGSQAGASTWNPGQMIGNQYVHMHVLRDVITNTWGDAIAPTTQGTLFTKTYEYQIPVSIGTPNGIDVDLNNITFLAWVSERSQDYDWVNPQNQQHYLFTAVRPILNACELEYVLGVDEPIYPIVASVGIDGLYECTQSKKAEINIQNIGTSTLNSMTVVMDYAGETYTQNWEGELLPFGREKIIIPMTTPFGTNDMTISITEANGQAYSFTHTETINSIEWVDLEVEGETETLKLMLMQDKFGNQTTWSFTASDGTVLASGGPYQILPGSSGTQIHVENVVVPVNECVRFTIRDAMGDGICCTSGNGYYIVKDSHNNVLFGDQNDGDFGEEFSHLISIRGGQTSEVEVGATEVLNMSYHEADFVAPLTFVDYPEEVGFSYRKVTNSNVMTVEGQLNEYNKVVAHVDGLDANSIYMVKAYAIVNGVTYYGSETTFQTVLEGVNDFAASLKLYPNPTSSVLNIEGEGINSVEVFNVVGQHVASMSSDGNKAQINTESLNAGVYFVRILANDGNMVNRTFTVVR